MTIRDVKTLTNDKPTMFTGGFSAIQFVSILHVYCLVHSNHSHHLYFQPQQAVAFSTKCSKNPFDITCSAHK